MKSEQPPAFVELLVGWFVPRDDREYLLGDLAEEFARLAANRGRWMAVLWYGTQLGTAIVGFMGEVAARVPKFVASAVSSLPGDVRHSVRTLARSPGYTAVSIGVLAVSIAGASAVFSVVKAVVVNPLNFDKSDRITAFWSAGNWSQAEFDVVRERTRAHSVVAAYSPFSRLALRSGGEPEMLVASAVTGDFFNVLRVAPAIGRALSVADEHPRTDGTVVLSYGLWLRRFGGDSTVIGRTISLGDKPHVIAGVMPQEFWFPSREVELWISAKVDPGTGSYRYNHFYHLIGRLGRDVTFEQASSDARMLGSALHAEFNYSQDFTKADGASVMSLKEKVVGNTDALLSILVGAVSLIMIIAYVTVAGLALNRRLNRRGDLAIRIALGADRGRLTSHLMGESLTLSVASVIVGVLLSIAAVRSLVAILPVNTPRLEGVGLEPLVLLVIVMFTVLVSIVFDQIPIMRGTDLGAFGLSYGGRHETAGGDRANLRRGLVVVETMLSVALVVVAGLLARSLWHLSSVDPGFTTEHVLTFEINPPRDYDDPKRTQLVDDLLAQLGQIEGMPVGAITRLPLRSGWSFAVEAADMIDDEDIPTAVPWRAVTPGLFETLDMRMVRGRLFDRNDGPAGAAVAVVNRRLADLFWPGTDPVGQRLRVRLPDREWMTVVGVVEDSRVTGLRDAVPPTLYQPYAQAARSNAVSVALRTTRDPLSTVPFVRSVVREIDPTVAIANVRTMASILDEEIGPSRNLFLVVGGFAVFSMMLGALGLFGVVSQTVATRTREMGIRLVLGAHPRALLTSVIAEGLVLAATGVVLGVAAALVLTRSLQQSLYGVGVNDPTTIVVVVLIQFTIAMIASTVPAIRASRVDPAIVLREN